MRSLISILLLVSACQTRPQVRERGELMDLVLKPRAKFVGHLTNQRCKTFDKNECVEWDLIKFDMRDDPTRKRLRDLKFICNVNGERFRPCPTSPGLCQQTVKKGGWFSRDKIIITRYLDFAENYQYMIDSRTWCAAQDSAEGQRMFSK